MAFVLEDGTGVTGANAYCDVAFLDSWAADRSYDLTAYDTAAKESAIIIASKDWIDLYHNFKGEKLSAAQGLKMPTDENVYDDTWRAIAANAAYLQLKGLLLVDEGSISTSGIVESESKKLASLAKSVAYAKGTAQTYRRNTPSLDAAIKPYLKVGGGFGSLYRW